MPTTTELTEKYLSEHPSIKDCLKEGIINYSKLSRKIANELEIEKKTNRLMNLYIYITSFIILIFILLFTFVFDISNKSLYIFIIIGGIILAAIFVLIAKKHPKFQEYRKQF